MPIECGRQSHDDSFMNILHDRASALVRQQIQQIAIVHLPRNKYDCKQYWNYDKIAGSPSDYFTQCVK